MPPEIVYENANWIYDKKVVKQKLLEIFGLKNVSDKEVDLFAYGKDFSLIASHWLLKGKIAAKPDFIVWPENVKQISKLLKMATAEKVPVIPFGSGSGVVGGALPIHGGIIVDMKKMDKIVEINKVNLTATIQTGINGMNLERALNSKGFTMGHIPQSVYTSTLGGYLAHKAAGQFSTKYGKIEDMILSLEAVLPDGTIIKSKPAPRKSIGPQLDKFLIGSEGTLAIITEVTVRIWPLPEKRVLISYAFPSMAQALEAVRSILQSQVYPAVIRIYDANETARHFPTEANAKDRCMTIFVCEGSQQIAEFEASIVSEKSRSCEGVACGSAPVEHWFATRFNVKESSTLIPLNLVVDTIEVAVMWDKANKLYQSVIASMNAVPGTVLATGHASHFYEQGVCFYFSFGGTAVKQTEEEYYRTVWKACIETTLQIGGTIAHHHSIGLNRLQWMKDEWGAAYDVIKRIKKSLDPNNILNPGKLFLHEVGKKEQKEK
ncbi:MAG: FAD-binding oxidoreductase [Candidatus Heimdallarchaeota archaeon]